MATAQATLSEIFVSYQGEGARVGEKHLFVRFAGCNLRCRYCDTPGSLERVAACEVTYPGGEVAVLPNPVPVALLASVVARFFTEDPSISQIALTGGEPMLQHRFIESWLTTAPPPVGCMLETAATLPAGLDGLAPLLASVSADIKLPSSSGEGPLWERHREFLKKCASTRLFLKMPVCRDTLDDHVRLGARMAREEAPGAPLYLQPVTDPDDGTWRLEPSRLLALAAVAAGEQARVFVLPQMHKLLSIR